MALPPFAGYSGSRQPRIVIVGEAWGENEEQAGGVPFCGVAGAELTYILLEAIPPNRFSGDLRWAIRRSGWHQMRNVWAKEAGIGFTNVFALHPPSNNLDPLLCAKKELPDDYPQLSPIGRGSTAYLKPEYLPELDRLRAELRDAAPTCVVACGAVASWAVLGRTDISNIRGTATMGTQGGVCPQIKVLPTYHPSAIVRGRHDWRVVCIADFIKAWRESERPDVVRPERKVIINPTMEELIEWAAQALKHDGPMGVDCETAGSLITCISFADSPQSAITIPFRSANGSLNHWPSADAEIQAWMCVRTLLESGRPLVFQNGMYDMQFLVRMGFTMKNIKDDTMLLHHSLYPEVQKGLGFLGSIYTNESSWKLLRKQRATKVKGEKLDE